MRWQRRSWLCAATGSRKDPLQFAPPPFPRPQPLEAGMRHTSPSPWKVRMGSVALVWASDSVHEPWWFGSLSATPCNLLCPFSASDFYMGCPILICDFPFSRHNFELRLVFWPSRQLCFVRLGCVNQHLPRLNSQVPGSASQYLLFSMYHMQHNPLKHPSWCFTHWL